jgi:PIN domain nuclease of toxin-antitoxin system
MFLKEGRRAGIVPDPAAGWRRYARQRGIRLLPIMAAHIGPLDAPPAHHADPFDRLLLCQCTDQGLHLAACDAAIRDDYQFVVAPVW